MILCSRYFLWAGNDIKTIINHNVIVYFALMVSAYLSVDTAHVGTQTQAGNLVLHWHDYDEKPPCLSWKEVSIFKCFTLSLTWPPKLMHGLHVDGSYVCLLTQFGFTGLTNLVHGTPCSWFNEWLVTCSLSAYLLSKRPHEIEFSGG